MTVFGGGEIPGQISSSNKRKEITNILKDKKKKPKQNKRTNKKQKNLHNWPPSN